MAKAQRLFRSLMAICLFLGVTASPQTAAALETADAAGPLAPAAVINTHLIDYPGVPDSFELLAENAAFELYADQATLAFKVVDKRSGYIWHSNLDEKASGDRLNKTWMAFAQSGISIDYLDQKAASLRASITNSSPSIDFTPTGQGFEASVTFPDASITLVVIVTLEPNGVRVEVPFESIKEENPDFKLGLLHVYPFLGATRGHSVPGYMFIPDGSGSLIRLAAETKATNMFYGRYYGADLGMITSRPFDVAINWPHQISVPVIGMVHGIKQNAFISIVENGASYGEIQAHPAGIITNFNFLYNAFIYNESYFQATNRSGAGVTTLQPKTNAFDVTIHYRFLTQDDGDYVGMAKSYQQYLVEKGILKPPPARGDIGIRLVFVGGEKEKILFWHRFIAMTTVGQMADILKDLDVKNPEVVYYGWQPLGASTMPPKTLKLDRHLGDLAQLRSLVEQVAAAGGNFYLHLDPQMALINETGYSPRYDLAMSITNFNLESYAYYLNFDAIRRRYSTLSAAVFSEQNLGLALDGLGSTLYSDFKNGNFMNRESAMAAYQSLLAENNGPTSFYMPNDYLFGNMKAYYDIPLTDSGYIYTTEAVPFLQIALAGYVPVYGPALNFSSNMRDDLLRHIDFDVYPSFFLSHEATAKILNTSSSWIYTSSYSQWGQEVKQTYAWLDGLLGPVRGQTIVARQLLADGVSATTYSNGKQIIVNYNDAPYSAGGVVVDGKNAILQEDFP